MMEGCYFTEHRWPVVLGGRDVNEGTSCPDLGKGVRAADAEILRFSCCQWNNMQATVAGVIRESGRR